jgi:hypothetical protein
MQGAISPGSTILGYLFKRLINDTLVPFRETFEPHAPLVIYNEDDLALRHSMSYQARSDPGVEVGPDRRRI